MLDPDLRFKIGSDWWFGQKIVIKMCTIIKHPKTLKKFNFKFFLEFEISIGFYALNFSLLQDPDPSQIKSATQHWNAMVCYSTI